MNKVYYLLGHDFKVLTKLVSLFLDLHIILFWINRISSGSKLERTNQIALKKEKASGPAVRGLRARSGPADPRPCESAQQQTVARVQPAGPASGPGGEPTRAPTISQNEPLASNELTRSTLGTMWHYSLKSQYMHYEP
jgi:hypothetical protein